MKRLFPFLFLILLVLLFGQLLTTYGVFETDVQVGTETPIAAWQINVNSVQLTDEPQMFEVTDVYWQTSPDVLPGRAAPNLKAYFDIIIDPAGTEVGIEYELNIAFSELVNEQIFVQSVQDADQNDLTEVDFETYVGTLSLEDVLNEEEEVIRVSFIWEHDEENNEIDSSMAEVFETEFSIPVYIRVLQYID